MEAHGREALIRGHRPKLDALAAALIDDEVLERPTIDRIMAEVPGLSDERIAAAVRPGDHVS